MLEAQIPSGSVGMWIAVGELDLRHPSKEERVALLIQLSLPLTPVVEAETAARDRDGEEAGLCFLVSNFNSEWPGQPFKQGGLNDEPPPRDGDSLERSKNTRKDTQKYPLSIFYQNRTLTWVKIFLKKPMASER